MIEHIRGILAVFARNGLFDEGVELIGSWCFYLYQKHFGVKDFPLLTQDVDFLIPRPFKGREHEDFIQQLKDIGFRAAHAPNGSLYLWNAELKIEFIVPQKGKGLEDTIKIKALGIDVVTLRYVELLLSDTIVVEDGGVEIRIPRPANFALQKLIIAPERKKIDKRLKDWQQAIYVSEAIQPEELRRLYDTLPKGWKKKITDSLVGAQKALPLLEKDINRLKVTLQIQ